MKFIISVVILALAVCSEAGYLPAVVDYSYGAWGAPSWGVSAWGPAANWGGAAPYGWGNGAYGPYGPSLTTSGPYGPYGAPYGPYGPTTAVHADPSPHGHDGKYVAANRGSVHVAPLVGHIQSVASTNLQPAPGTTW